MATATQRQKSSGDIAGNVRTYKETISLLDSLKQVEHDAASPKRIKQLDKLLGNPSKKMDIILVGGTNGKSSTINFANKSL